MNHSRLLTILSVICMVLLATHIADDFFLGFDKNVVKHSEAILIFVVWSCGLVFARERIIGRVILLLGGLMSIGMPIIHLRGRGYDEAFINSGGATRFISTLYALGTLGALTAILAVQEMVLGWRRKAE